MTFDQTKILLDKFKSNPYLNKEQKHHLATSLNVSVKRIEQWYGVWRFKQIEKGLLEKSEYLKLNSNQ